MRKEIILILAGAASVAALAQSVESSSEAASQESRVKSQKWATQKLSPRAANEMTLSATASQREDKVVSVYIHTDADFEIETAREIAMNIAVLTPELCTARVSMSRLSELAQLPGVTYIQGGAKGEQQLNLARPATGINRVHAGEGLETPFTGQGVVIGIVDAGFDYGHPAFRDREGNLRIKRVWEQRATPADGQGTPERFGYGLELTTPEAILAAQGDISGNSHGTHVAGIAAGNDAAYDAAYVGMAPDAEIVLVSMDSSGTYDVNISNGIAYIFDYADEVGKPCAINLSLCTNAGPHDGTSSFDRIADALTGEGRLIVGASGNYNKNNFHLMRTFSSGEDTPLRTFLDYVSGYSAGGDLEIWSSADVEIALLSYKTNTQEVDNRVVIYPAEDGAGSVSLGRNVTGDYAVSSEINMTNGKHHVMVSSNISTIRSNYAVAIEVMPKGAGQVDIWTTGESFGLVSKNIDGFSAPTDEPTVGEIGGTANSILTVGAYTTRKDFVKVNETTVNSLNETVGDISSFSCFGPTADGRQKPNITAPGCYIISAVSNYDTSWTLAEAQEGDGRWNYYGYMQGTSMATPMVTGIVATWLQANPALSPSDLQEIMQATAVKDEFTGESLPAQKWGFGKVDALAGIKKAIDMSGVNYIPAEGMSDLPVVLGYEDGELTATFFTSGTANLSLYNLTGSRVWTGIVNATAGASNVITSDNLPVGAYILTATLRGTTHSLKFIKR